jgi:chemotaxis protein MotB
MKRIIAGLVGSMVVVCALAAGGCQDQTKEQLATCQKDRDALRDKNVAQQRDLDDANANLKQVRDDALAKDGQLAELNGKLRAALARADKSKPPTPATGPASHTAAGWTATAVGDKVTVGSDLLFKPGKAALSSEGEKELKKFAKDLTGAGPYAKLPIRILGFTDSDKITKSDWDDNWELSANRALNVARFLVKQGVDAKRIEPVAMGEYHPVNAGKGNDAKKQNRRVEIVVIK